MGISKNLKATRICGLVVLFLWLTCLAPAANADEAAAVTGLCVLPSDTDPNFSFLLKPWFKRGICIRENDDSYLLLEVVLRNINKIKESEYASAASILSLLPTIGALFGPPTREIWRLRTIVPFGGALAMLLSFGGALMPVRVEDYEDIIHNGRGSQSSVFTLSRLEKDHQITAGEKQTRLTEMAKRVRARIDQGKSVRLPKRILFLGLFVMFALWILAQGAIAVAEQGGVIHFWVSNPVWFHFWYILAFTEDRVQRPFVKTYKLLVSSVPYDLEVSGGLSILEYTGHNTPTEGVAVALGQLKTLRPASLTLLGSTLRTRARNSVMVTVSVAGPNRYDSVWKNLSKCMSVAVFVTGTAVFASVCLLSLIVAIGVLTLTLAAGVFGRVIIGWIISQVSDTEPMFHVITASNQDAYEAITEILGLKPSNGCQFQVELDGQIFIEGRRVASRTLLSRVKLATLGVLVEPYDLANSRKLAPPLPGDILPGGLSTQMSHVSGHTASVPFLRTAAIDQVLPFAQQGHGSAQYIGQQKSHSISGDSISDPSFRINRKPVPGTDTMEV